ncbi:mediator of RNA polymerase II transcription subunit 30 isoform X5 [Synchiropus splendidus]|uniref:mediator of RNA polymerase II transcription subunit 30 isoform X5 n=1 Tax=Synchiropus splendidus TaxID=270530 RepID=UPI00237DAD9E|nr:mediator of RNA polymerase II transcription subunit 30 isoform X5 [Synchiropus splendidus]
MKACEACCVAKVLSHNPLPTSSSPEVSMTTPTMAFGGQPPPQLQPQPPQQVQAARDVNTATLCRIGQEAVQDIVLRTMEIFQLLRNMQQLIPFVEDDKHEDRSTSQGRQTAEERREVLEVTKSQIIESHTDMENLQTTAEALVATVTVSVTMARVGATRKVRTSITSLPSHPSLWSLTDWYVFHHEDLSDASLV